MRERFAVNDAGAFRAYFSDSNFNQPIHLGPSLRANGSRECAPDDRLREAIHASQRRPRERGDPYAVPSMFRVASMALLDRRALATTAGGYGSPHSRRVIRGKLCIAEADLVGGSSVAGGGRGDPGRSIDIGDRRSH